MSLNGERGVGAIDRSLHLSSPFLYHLSCVLLTTAALPQKQIKFLSVSKALGNPPPPSGGGGLLALT